jgi:hypothetical protein
VNYQYANVSNQPLGLVVRQFASSWWKWSTSQWTSPFVFADHVLQCTPDPDPNPSTKTCQYATVPGAALAPPNAVLWDGFIVGNGATATWTPWISYAAPLSSLAFAGQGSLSRTN